MLFIKPTEGLTSSHFNPNRRNPVTGVYRPHTGVDIGWHRPDTRDDIVAAAGGKVVIPRYSKLAGNYLWIEHGNGYTTVYSHLSKITVKNGQRVKQGQKIGVKGTTGNSTGVHLHFEVIKHRTFSNSWSHKRNPLLYFVDPTTKEWQGWLKEAGIYKGSVDGIYGEGTVRAVLAYQRKYGLAADGVCGRGTYNHMKKTIKGKTSPPSKPKEEGGLTMSQYKELKGLIEQLQKDLINSQAISDTQRKDLKHLLQEAHKKGLLHVDHSGDVDTMTQRRAIELLISVVSRWFTKE